MIALASVSPSDYTIEFRALVGHGPVWVISRSDEALHFFPDEPLAMRVVRELAHFAHCDAWLITAGAAPVLLTATADSA